MIEIILATLLVVVAALIYVAYNHQRTLEHLTRHAGACNESRDHQISINNRQIELNNRFIEHMHPKTPR